VSAGREARAPWGWTVGVSLVGGCYAAACGEALAVLIRRTEWNWVEVGLHVGLGALGIAAAVGLQRAGWLPAWGDRDGRAMLQTALETGAVPAGARTDAWRRLLRQEADDARQGRWLAAAFMAPVAVLVAAAALVAKDGTWTLWALAVVLAGFTPIPVRWLARRQQRAEALLARLDAT
jgi:hypothetical protein